MQVHSFDVRLQTPGVEKKTEELVSQLDSLLVQGTNEVVGDAISKGKGSPSNQ